MERSLLAARDDARLAVAVPVERREHGIGIRHVIELGTIEILEPREIIATEHGRGGSTLGERHGPLRQ